jgi:transcriptional regulator with XRE-family HTH domain
VDGEALRRARAELGITRDQLVAYSGVSRETLRKMEEKAYIPKPETVVAIQRGLTKAAQELGVLQRLQALEAQVHTLEALVRLLLEARQGSQVAPQGE